jgi:hypothetical protein
MRRSRRPGPFNPNLDRRGACSPFPRLLHPGSKPRNVAMELEDRAPTLPAPDPSDPFARSHPLRDPWPINNTPCLSRRFAPRDSLLCIQCATLDVTAVFSVGPGNRPRIARPLRKRDTDLLTFASGSRLALSRARNAIANRRCTTEDSTSLFLTSFFCRKVEEGKGAMGEYQEDRSRLHFRIRPLFEVRQSRVRGFKLPDLRPFPSVH